MAINKIAFGLRAFALAGLVYTLRVALVSGVNWLAANPLLYTEELGYFPLVAISVTVFVLYKYRNK